MCPFLRVIERVNIKMITTKKHRAWGRIPRRYLVPVLSLSLVAPYLVHIPLKRPQVRSGAGEQHWWRGAEWEKEMVPFVGQSAGSPSQGAEERGVPAGGGHTGRLESASLCLCCGKAPATVLTPQYSAHTSLSCAPLCTSSSEP